MTNSRPRISALRRPSRPAPLAGTLLAATFLLLTAGTVPAADTALLVPPGAAAGPEATAVRALATARPNTIVVIANGGGSFTTPDGNPCKLSDTPVVWLHEGDNQAPPSQFIDRKTVNALRKHVSDGGAVFLTGTTMPLVEQLNPHFPALQSSPRLRPAGRSGPTAGSGAARQKQIPSSRKFMRPFAPHCG